MDSYLWVIFLLFSSMDLVYSESENITTNVSDQINVDLKKCVEESEVLFNHRNECCSTIYKKFRLTWYRGERYLTDFLKTLRNWNCSEFDDECSEPTYDYTPFTELVYDNFCSRPLLLKKCTKVLEGVVMEYNFPKNETFNDRNHTRTQDSEETWLKLTSSLRPRGMSMETLNKPCVQIALFDRPSGGAGRFFEFAQPFTLFCDITWVGYDIDTVMERDVSPWTSWPVSCRASNIIGMIITGILCLSVVIANIIVITVYTTTPKLFNSQAIFKISIAGSDLLTGLVILPNMIIFQYLFFVAPRKTGGIISTNSLINDTSKPLISTLHIEGVGFITVLSLSVSIYSLLFASFDRFWAVFRPLHYSKFKATSYAKVSCFVTWIVASCIATVPLFIPVLEYRLTAGMLVSSVGLSASILLAIAFVIPMLTMCGVNFGTLQSTKKHARVRQKLKSNVGPPDDIEKRLSKILGLMVGVLNACILPIFILQILSAVLTNVLFTVPKKLSLRGIVAYNSAGYCCCLILLSNGLWNCLIYSTRGEEFRKAVKSMKIFKFISSSCATAFSSVRRLSNASMRAYHRRKSSSSSGNFPTNSSQITRLPSGRSSVSSQRNKSPAHMSGSSRGVWSSDSSKMHYSRETSNSESHAKDCNEGESNYSVSELNSFAVNAGADRFFESVMENIAEEDENSNKL